MDQVAKNFSGPGEATLADALVLEAVGLFCCMAGRSPEVVETAAGNPAPQLPVLMDVNLHD